MRGVIFCNRICNDFPQGKYAGEVRGWLDKVEVSLIEAQLDRRVKRPDDGRNPLRNRMPESHAGCGRFQTAIHLNPWKCFRP